MIEKYYFIEAKVPVELEAGVDLDAHDVYKCTGIEEFAIEEAKVDEILGERSYSGGDVPESVITEVESVLKSEGVIKKYYFSNQAESRVFKAYLDDSFKIPSELREEAVKDWNQEWKKSYKPILVGTELEIIPEWEKKLYSSTAEKQIYIYPGMGFGTGSHETTFLCLKLFLDILKTKQSLESCLDFGCGSGILGIAYRLFELCGCVDLYDIDKDAIKNSIQNIVLNDLDEKEFNLLLPPDRDKIDKKYSLVFANILQNVLIAESDYLANCLMDNGHLILSGLLKGQEDEVISCFEKNNSKLKYVKTLDQGDWVAVLMSSK